MDREQPDGCRPGGQVKGEGLGGMSSPCDERGRTQGLENMSVEKCQAQPPPWSCFLGHSSTGSVIIRDHETPSASTRGTFYGTHEIPISFCKQKEWLTM